MTSRQQNYREQQNTPAMHQTNRDGRNQSRIPPQQQRSVPQPKRSLEVDPQTNERVYVNRNSSKQPSVLFDDRDRKQNDYDNIQRSSRAVAIGVPIQPDIRSIGSASDMAPPPPKRHRVEKKIPPPPVDVYRQTIPDPPRQTEVLRVQGNAPVEVHYYSKPGGLRNVGSGNIPPSGQEYPIMTNRMDRTSRSRSVSYPASDIGSMDEHISPRPESVREVEVISHTIAAPRKTRTRAPPKCNWNASEHDRGSSRLINMSTDIDLYGSPYEPVINTELLNCGIEIVVTNDGKFGAILVSSDGTRCGKIANSEDVELLRGLDASTHVITAGCRWTSVEDLGRAGRLFEGKVAWKARDCPVETSVTKKYSDSKTKDTIPQYIKEEPIG